MGPTAVASRQLALDIPQGYLLSHAHLRSTQCGVTRGWVTDGGDGGDACTMSLHPQQLVTTLQTPLTVSRGLRGRLKNLVGGAQPWRLQRAQRFRLNKWKDTVE